MGTVTTDRAITEPWTIENHGAPGVFGLVSRDSSQSITVEVMFVPDAYHPGAAGGEAIELVHAGDACSFDLATVETIRVYAGTLADPGTYPAHALINFTVLPITLTSAPFLAGGPLPPGGGSGNVSPGSGPGGVPSPIPVTVVSTIGAPCVPTPPTLPLFADHGAPGNIAASLTPIPWTILGGSDPSWVLDGSGNPLAPVAGWYQFTAHVGAVNQGGSTWDGLDIAGPGLAVQSTPISSAGGSDAATITELLHMNAGDPFVFNLELLHTGGAGNVRVSADLRIVCTVPD